jgi:putative peptidoglycan lipid II flippase
MSAVYGLRLKALIRWLGLVSVLAAGATLGLLWLAMRLALRTEPEPLALAAFPALAEAHARRDRAGFTHLLTRTLQQVLFFAVPTAAFTIIFRAQAVRLLLGYGRFTWDDTVTTLGALGVLALAVVPQAVAPLLSRAFFSLHNTVSPVVANLASISVNLVVALALGHRAGIGGIAWAFVIASWLNVVLLWLMLRPKLGEGARAIERSAWRTLVATTGAAAIGCAAAYGVLYASAPLVGTDTVLGLAIQTGSAALAGVIAFFATAAQLGTQEARAALDLIKKIWYRTTAFRT